MGSCIHRWGLPSSMKYVSAWDMVFSQNNDQRRGQHRAVKTKSNSTATRRHRVSLLAWQPLAAASRGGGGNLNYVPGAPSSCRLDKVVIVTQTVCVSLQRLHACLAVRLSMFVLWQMFWVYFAGEMSKVLTVFVSQCWWAWTVYFTHSQRACVSRTCKYCHLMMEYLTVTFF